MNKFVSRVVCTGKEAKIEWENAQQLHADSLETPCAGREGKAQIGNGSAAPFCILSEAWRHRSSWRSSWQKLHFGGQQQLSGPQGLTFMKQIKGKKSRPSLLEIRDVCIYLHCADAQIAELGKSACYKPEYEKCDFWSLASELVFLLTYSAQCDWGSVGAAAAQHRFYVCEKQIKFYAIGRSSAGGGAQLRSFLLSPADDIRETDRPPLWAHRFSALSPRARIIESKCQAPHTRETTWDTHGLSTTKRTAHTLAGITARDKKRK